MTRTVATSPGVDRRYIRVRNAREHNLRSVSVDIPRNALTVVTGPSGSGKSSLAFATVHAEGQRQYLESLSPFERQGFDRLPKPKVGSVTGLGPTIAIPQRLAGRNPRSTVGGVTEISELVRFLFARIGVRTCLGCGERAMPSITSLGMAMDDPESEVACTQCGRATRTIAPQNLNPMSPNGMCSSCEGLGTRLVVSESALVDDPRASIRTGALAFYGDRRRSKKTYWPVRDLPDLLGLFGASLETPWCELSPALHEVILYGSTIRQVPPSARAALSKRAPVGLVGEIERLFRTAAPDRKDRYRRYMTALPCSDCRGTRLNADALAIRLADQDIAEVMRCPIDTLSVWLAKIRRIDLPSLIAEAVSEVAGQMRRRVSDVVAVGLDYLSLDRPIPTLSAGEGQRLRLARQLGTGLVGVCYIFDEPTAGLHPQEVTDLVDGLRRLRDAGNTVIVVEHDAAMIRSADYILDLGPGAGTEGGRLVCEGSPADVARHPASHTARELRGELTPVTKVCRVPNTHAPLILTGANLHNLRNLEVSFPLGVLTCVTGPSGSGKSTLVMDMLKPTIQTALSGGPPPLGIRSLCGHDHFRRLVSSSQDPIARSRRSVPATYLGLFDDVRELFARTPAAVCGGLSSSHFSFNTTTGQCAACRGSGELSMDLHFLPEVTVTCPACKGRRYKDDVLKARFDGLDISELLSLEADQAAHLFAGHPSIAHPLHLLADIGLGYIRLGQSCATLSAGEAQRLKLCRDLIHNRGTGETLYLLDEPSAGLHAADVALLVRLLHLLVNAGNTVIVIEHDLHVIAAADWLVDLGPGGGTSGGRVVATGTPRTIAEGDLSPLSPYLRRTLDTVPVTTGSTP